MGCKAVRYNERSRATHISGVHHGFVLLRTFTTFTCTATGFQLSHAPHTHPHHSSLGRSHHLHLLSITLFLATFMEDGAAEHGHAPHANTHLNSLGRSHHFHLLGLATAILLHLSSLTPRDGFSGTKNSRLVVSSSKHGAPKETTAISIFANAGPRPLPASLSTYRVHHRHRHAEPRKPRHSPLEAALVSRHDCALDGRGEV